jgi:predicted alpha-1,6-mannanase (GH76 family)
MVTSQSLSKVASPKLSTTVDTSASQHQMSKHMLMANTSTQTTAVAYPSRASEAHLYDFHSELWVNPHTSNL